MLEQPCRRLGPMTVRRQILACAAGSFLTIAAPFALAAAPGMPAGLSAPAKPMVMPAFDLPTIAGTPLRSENLKGQVLVIRFWASW